MTTKAETAKKALLIRVDRATYGILVEMASQERRSISSMVDVLLHTALQQRKAVPRPQAEPAA